MPVIVLLPRGTYATSEAVGSASIGTGNRLLRFVVERHDGAQGEPWPSSGAAVSLDWSRNANGPWRDMMPNLPLRGGELAGAGDPRGIPQGQTWHIEIVMTCPPLATHVRCRFRSAVGTIRTGVGVEATA